MQAHVNGAAPRDLSWREGGGGGREDNRRRGHKRRKGERSKKSQLARALATPRRTVACAPLRPRRCAGRARKARDINIFFRTIRTARRRHLSRAQASRLVIPPHAEKRNDSRYRPLRNATHTFTSFFSAFFLLRLFSGSGTAPGTIAAKWTRPGVGQTVSIIEHWVHAVDLNMLCGFLFLTGPKKHCQT